MGFHNSDEALAGLAEELLDAAMGLEELRQGKERPAKLNDALFVITSEFSEWGLDSVEKFHEHVLPIHACKAILQRRDRHEAWHKSGQTVRDIYNAIYPDYNNLLKILAHRGDGDFEQAKKFCLLLHDVAINLVWKQIRGRGRCGLAA